MSPTARTLEPQAQYVHYSAHPLGAVRSVASESQGVGHKPKGLWFSVEGEGDGWREWCEGESWGLDRLAHRHTLTLEESRMLSLCGEVDIVRFHRQYRARLCRGVAAINWRAVAGDYDGIIIAPYCWSLRFDSEVSWYYGWDCASGCVWEARAVLAVQHA